MKTSVVESLSSPPYLVRKAKNNDVKLLTLAAQQEGDGIWHHDVSDAVFIPVFCSATVLHVQILAQSAATSRFQLTLSFLNLLGIGCPTPKHAKAGRGEAW